jgi:hypothetical protein
MKLVIVILLSFCLSFELSANTDREVILKIDRNNSNSSNIAALIKKHEENNRPNRIVFEFYDSNTASFLEVVNPDSAELRKKIYQNTYPNGDFYYLIGDLSDEWTKSDYKKFYSVAKWLSLRGFRTILNVAAYEPDLQEAVSNENTTAIIWNSHGRNDGTIYGTGKKAIDYNLFINLRLPSLKYVLFANCWGSVSSEKYGLRKMEKMVAEGWDEAVTSDHLYRYIFSTNFDQSLSKALEKDIRVKPTLKIEI